MRCAYEAHGLWGLVDRRVVRRVSPTGRVDPRIVEVVVDVIACETDESTGTVIRLRRRVTKVLAERYGPAAPALPPERTFYRLVGRLARRRPGLRGRPPGP